MKKEITIFDNLGFSSILGLIFITLKLLGKIDWSWWWVLSPFWIGLILMIFVIIFTIGLMTKITN